MKITKAIIPVAGWGTRMLPITKAIEKCMLPVGNRPVVDYIVQDVIKAGITDIYFVVGEQSSQIQAYYGKNSLLESYLIEHGKEDKLPLVAPVDGVNFYYITQPSNGKYGTAVPVGLCAEYIDEDESVLVLMGDDFFYDGGQTNEISRLIEESNDGEAAMLAHNIAKESVVEYGVLNIDDNGNYIGIIEKPAIEDAPSTLVNTSKYLMTKSMIDVAGAVEVNSRHGEYQITDVINNFVELGGVMRIVEARSEYMDCGNIQGWLHANNQTGLRFSESSTTFRET